MEEVNMIYHLGRLVLLLLSTLLFLPSALASDTQVWQGQYYKGTTFQTGTFEFNFTVYDNRSGGVACYSNTTVLATGNFGEWKTEQRGVGDTCNDSFKNYYLEISINNETQSQRKLLKSFDYLRKDTNEETTGALQSSQFLTSKNVTGVVRWSVRNTNPENTSLTLFSIMNDLGNLLTLSMTSSSYFSIENNRSFNNQPALGQSTFNDMYFINGRHTGFQWFTNPNNDSSNIISNLMNLTSSGNLAIIGNFTSANLGFFFELGSLINRITTLFVQDIYFNGTISGSGNINLSSDISVTGNLTIGGQIATNNGCLVPHANFWGERAGAITAGGAPVGLQYSFGDGNTDGGPAQPCSGKIVYLTVHAQTANNGNGRIDLIVNSGLNSTCNVATPATSGGTTMANCSLSFNAGDTLTPRTTVTPSGTNNGYVVAWWVVYD